MQCRTIISNCSKFPSVPYIEYGKLKYLKLCMCMWIYENIVAHIFLHIIIASMPMCECVMNVIYFSWAWKYALKIRWQKTIQTKRVYSRNNQITIVLIKCLHACILRAQRLLSRSSSCINTHNTTCNKADGNSAGGVVAQLANGNGNRSSCLFDATVYSK